MLCKINWDYILNAREITSSKTFVDINFAPPECVSQLKMDEVRDESVTFWRNMAAFRK